MEARTPTTLYGVPHFPYSASSSTPQKGPGAGPSLMWVPAPQSHMGPSGLAPTLLALLPLPLGPSQPAPLVSTKYTF